MRARGEGPRRHPESPADPGLPPAAPPAAHLRSPLTRLQPPPHGEYTRARSPAAPAPCLYSFFRLVLPIWVLVVVVIIIIPKDSIASLSALPASRLVALSKLTPQAPRAGEGSLSRPGRCSLSLRTTLCPGFPLWLSKFGSFPRVPLLLDPGSGTPSPIRENPGGTPDRQSGEDALGSGRSLHCMRARHTCRFRETEKTLSFPRTVAPSPPP